MGDAAVDEWKLEGRFFVWFYPAGCKGLEGWHLSADAMGCASLVDLIDRIAVAEWTPRKRIPVDVPGRMLVGPKCEWKPVPILWMALERDEAETFWRMEQAQGDGLSLRMGPAKLREVRESLVGLPDWQDDFAIGPERDGRRRLTRVERAADAAQRLWFWTRVE